MLFQFVVYPALVKTIGIVWLVRGSGVLGAFVFLAVPDFQRLAWSDDASYVLGIVAVVLVGTCASVVRSFLLAKMYLNWMLRMAIRPKYARSTSGVEFIVYTSHQVFFHD